MKPSHLYEALSALIPERVPIHVSGACGVGKSQIVGQVAGDLGLDFLDVRAVQLDPVDLRGLPYVAPGRRPNGHHPSSFPPATKESSFLTNSLQLRR